MTRKHGISSQKQLKVDKSLFGTYQMDRGGKRLVEGAISPGKDSETPRPIQKSADVMNSRMADSPSYSSVCIGRRRGGKITRWVFTATHAMRFVKVDAEVPGYNRIGDTY